MKKHMLIMRINTLIALCAYSFALTMEPKGSVTLCYPENMTESIIQCSKHVQ